MSARPPLAAGPDLPSLYLITPQPGESDARFLRELDAALRACSGPPPLVQLRAHGLAVARWQALAREALQLCRGHGARLLLGAGALARWDPDLLLGLGADGLHLPSRLLDRARELPCPPGLLLGASCHDQGQLRRAGQGGADLVTLSPVLPTASHPGAPGIGWERLRQLCAGTLLPVYALGGLGPADLAQARAAGAHGVAGIRALWPGVAASGSTAGSTADAARGGASD